MLQAYEEALQRAKHLKDSLLAGLCPAPDLRVEVTAHDGLPDVVAVRYDLGVRNGDQVANGMIAMCIGPDRRMVLVGAPAFFERAPKPKKPKDLLGRNCVALRFAIGDLYSRELKKGKRETRVRVEGQAAFNGSYHVLNAVVSGCGLAFVPEDLAVSA